MCGGFLGNLTGANKVANSINQENALMQEQLMMQQQIAQQATQQADAAAAQATATQNQDTGIVNNDFNNTFTPGFYQGYKNAYTGYYDPQVSDQYSQAKDQLTAALSQNGTLESTVGAQALGDLAKRDADQVAAINAQGDNAVNSLKSNVSNAKTNLYDQANAAINPSTIASNAQGATTALAAPMAYTPLSSVFADLVTPFANYTHAAANAPVGGVPVVTPQTANAYGNASAGVANPYTGSGA